MSYITESFIQCGSDPRITSAKLPMTTYLFLRIACHSLWPIFHLHTIPLERRVFLYALVSDASISFPHLFLRSLDEIHRSSAVGHALVYPIFIHRILLILGLDGFPAFEPIHVTGPIGASFLRLRAAHFRPPHVQSSGAIPPPSSSTGDAQVEVSSAFDVPSPTTSDDSDIRRTLDHVLTVQAAHEQILVDLLDEVRALHAELAHFRRSPSPPPFDDGV